ncbi:MAG: hypothetical protein AAF500_01580 [Myxococcota bacterium]
MRRDWCGAIRCALALCLLGCGDPDAAPRAPRFVDLPPTGAGGAATDGPESPVEPPPPTATAIEPEVLSDGTQRFDLPRYVPGSADAPEGAVLDEDDLYEVTVAPDYAQISDMAMMAAFELCTPYGIETGRIVITVGDCDAYPLDFVRATPEGLLTFAFGEFNEGNGFFYSEARIRWGADP